MVTRYPAVSEDSIMLKAEVNHVKWRYKHVCITHYIRRYQAPQANFAVAYVAPTLHATLEF